MEQETFGETPDTAFGTCKESKGQCQKFDFPCTWGKFEPTFVVFWKSAQTTRLYADGLGVRWKSESQFSQSFGRRTVEDINMQKHLVKGEKER